jgi:hypothetical protein
MKLARLALHRFAGAPDGAWSFLHPVTAQPHPVTLVTGRAASGKTSLLRAVAAVKELVGGYGPPPDPAHLRRRGEPTGKISATWLLTPAEAARAGLTGPSLETEVSLDDGPSPLFDPGVRALFSTFAAEPSTGKFELFPANRAIPRAHPAAPAVPTDLATARLRLSDEPRKYAGVRGALVELALADAAAAAGRLAERAVVARWEQADSLAPIKQALAALAPRLRLAGVDLRGGAPEVRFARDDGRELELADLSASEEQALLFAVMFDRIGLAGSVVLVDQPELSLHPDDQARVLRVLATLREDNQIIAATTSEALLAAADPTSVLRLS